MMSIPTIYNGVRYRSRLEARWAVVFSALEWTYNYEPEGWNHDGRCYLPDFWILDWKTYLSIKPNGSGPRYEAALRREFRWQHTAFCNGELLLILVGDPVPNQFRIYTPSVLAENHRDEMHPDELGITEDALLAGMSCRFGERCHKTQTGRE